MRFVRKIRGSKAHKFLLDSQNYVYAVSLAERHRIYWRCLEARTKAKCPARRSTLADEIVHIRAEHNHASNFDPNSMQIIYDHSQDQQQIDEGSFIIENQHPIVETPTSFE